MVDSEGVESQGSAIKHFLSIWVLLAVDEKTHEESDDIEWGIERTMRSHNSIFNCWNSKLDAFQVYGVYTIE